jgi:hypothetical protein
MVDHPNEAWRDDCLSAVELLKKARRTTTKKQNTKKFPSLYMCERVVRKSFSNKKLTESERHVIGTLWAWLESKYS